VLILRDLQACCVCKQVTGGAGLEGPGGGRAWLAGTDGPCQPNPDIIAALVQYVKDYFSCEETAEGGGLPRVTSQMGRRERVKIPRCNSGTTRTSVSVDLLSPTECQFAAFENRLHRLFCFGSINRTAIGYGSFIAGTPHWQDQFRIT